ncbi:hypothetical protein M501DRAFT_986210 [Patellaria atrata CBS 101060]|uniref:Zn(2)-C6 fungal-type domain-containing protein n=1 Tax=Patellaria atrata CBS 101060 TaxID=1346257 RepID=A0A9P4VPK3_9PEZI|nr:hypothetical protein M501DRAFT_986210 [Patellaria atrata CBS 101060]
MEGYNRYPSPSTADRGPNIWAAASTSNDQVQASERSDVSSQNHQQNHTHRVNEDNNTDQDAMQFSYPEPPSSYADHTTNYATASPAYTSTSPTMAATAPVHSLLMTAPPQVQGLTQTTAPMHNYIMTTEPQQSTNYALASPTQDSPTDYSNPLATPDQNAARKRTKASRACDECRRKKVKCDAEDAEMTNDAPFACNRCRRTNTSCTYDRPTQKRGPNKGYINHLSERLAVVENFTGVKQNVDSLQGEGPSGLPVAITKRKREPFDMGDLANNHLPPSYYHSPSHPTTFMPSALNYTDSSLPTGAEDFGVPDVVMTRYFQSIHATFPILEGFPVEFAQGVKGLSHAMLESVSTALISAVSSMDHPQKLRANEIIVQNNLNETGSKERLANKTRFDLEVTRIALLMAVSTDIGRFNVEFMGQWLPQAVSHGEKFCHLNTIGSYMEYDQGLENYSRQVYWSIFIIDTFAAARTSSAPLLSMPPELAGKDKSNLPDETYQLVRVAFILREILKANRTWHSFAEAGFDAYQSDLLACMRDNLYEAIEGQLQRFREDFDQGIFATASVVSLAYWYTKVRLARSRSSQANPSLVPLVGNLVDVLSSRSGYSPLGHQFAWEAANALRQLAQIPAYSEAATDLGGRLVSGLSALRLAPEWMAAIKEQLQGVAPLLGLEGLAAAAVHEGVEGDVKGMEAAAQQAAASASAALQTLQSL